MNIEETIFIQLHSYPVIAIVCMRHPLACRAPKVVIVRKSIFEMYINLILLVTRECFKHTGVLIFFPSIFLSQFFLFGKNKGIFNFSNFLNFTILEENLRTVRNFYFIQKDFSLQIKF